MSGNKCKRRHKISESYRGCTGKEQAKGACHYNLLVEDVNSNTVGLIVCFCASEGRDKYSPPIIVSQCMEGIEKIMEPPRQRLHK